MSSEISAFLSDNKLTESERNSLKVFRDYKKKEIYTTDYAVKLLATL